MRVLNNLKLSIKLPLMLVTIAMVALTIMGVSAYREAYRLLESEGSARLERTLNARVAGMQGWQDRVQSDLRSLAGNAVTARALYDFDRGWKQLGDNAAKIVARAYRDENPNSPDARSKLDYAGDATDYSIQHRRYHAGFQAEAAQKGYSDLYLIDREGRVVYSINKDAVYASDLAQGSGPLAALAHEDAQATDAQFFTSEVLIEDGKAEIYATMPVISANGMRLGVVAVRIPATDLGQRIGGARGLGETGQGLIVDHSGRLLNSLRHPVGGLALGAVVETDAVKDTLAGGSGLVEQIGLAGQPVTAAYMPFSLFGRGYGAVVEQDQTELFAPATTLARSMLLHASWLVLALGALSAIMARSVSTPLRQLGATIRAISMGERDQPVHGTARRDEVGVIAHALDDLRTDLAKADAVQQEAHIKGTVFQNASAALMMIDADFRIIHVNKAVINLVGGQIDEFRKVTPDIDADALVGRSMDDFHMMPEKARALLNDRTHLPFHVDIKVGDGRFGVDVSEITDEADAVIGFVVEWREVTQLRAQRALLDSIDAHQLVCDIDPDFAITRLNDKICAMLGPKSARFLGQDMRSVLSAPDGHDIWSAPSSLKAVQGRFTLKGPDGRNHLIEGTINPVADRSARMMKIVLIAVDITASNAALEEAQAHNSAMTAAQNIVVEALRLGLGALSRGDLSTKISDEFDTQYEPLRADFNAAVSNLCAAMQIVNENATTIDSEAREIANASEDLSKRTEQQAATLEQTAAALGELSASVSASAQGVAEADRVVSDARKSAEDSGEIVKQAVSAMSEIETSSQQISKIIGVIDEIAFQTNLLALNAGVEAARAGEAGRGFAVVASEVRALAQRSSDAAREIDTLITASSDHVTRGVDLVGETGHALEGILGSVLDVAGRVSQIAQNAREQALSLTEINTAIAQLDQVTQQNAAMFEQTTAASHSLKSGARELNETMQHFKVPMTSIAPTHQKPKPQAQVVRSSSLAAPPRPAAPSDAPPKPIISLAPSIQQGNVALRYEASEDDWEDF
ncbi:methyl-accepting chemotaxis protein [Thioclava sp.]|uniref:methyl-accepting chemotaxis protein n=1 Tax=Thioclava sp. TaxID=1933450 RepID=UPI003AA7F046